MYAVVDIAGQQFKVEENATYYVPKLNTEVNKSVTFDNILLFSDGKSTSIGTPSVKGIKVKAKVLEHLKDDKVIVFKKKRQKEQIQRAMAQLEEERDMDQGNYEQERNQLVSEALSQLGENCRNMLTWRTFEEMPYKEISQKLNYAFSLNTLRVQFLRCLQKLKHEISSENQN